MKVEDMLKEAMGEQKLSEDARERIISGALARMPETAPEPVKRPFYCSPLFRRISVGLCACIVLAAGLFLILTIHSDSHSDEQQAKDAAQSAIPVDSDVKVTQQGGKQTDSDFAPVGLKDPETENNSATDKVYYSIGKGNLVIYGNVYGSQNLGVKETKEPESESGDPDLLSEVLKPVRKYVEDLKEPAGYVLIEVSEENGIVKAVLMPVTEDLISENKLNIDALCGQLTESPDSYTEPVITENKTLTVCLEKDPATGEYRVVATGN